MNVFEVFQILEKKDAILRRIEEAGEVSISVARYSLNGWSAVAVFTGSEPVRASGNTPESALKHLAVAINARR